MRPSFPRSGVLVLGPNSVDSLVPHTLVSQVEALLESHRIEDAVDLADKQRKKLQESIRSMDEAQAEELRYVYQRIGFQCFTETLFEDAGKHFFNGDLDPRLLISYFPDLRGRLFTVEDSVDVFSGVAEKMPKEASVDDIIRNYSPHLAPNTRAAPPTAELRRILGMAAREMLEVFLKKWRVKQKVEAESSQSSRDTAGAAYTVSMVVNTVLVKLLAEFEKTKELYDLLDETDDIVLSEVESPLVNAGQYNALCTLCKKRGEDLKLLDIWSKLIDGQWTDEHIEDPLSDMISLLTAKRDRALTQQWGIWLLRRDMEKGLKLLMPKDSGKRRERPEEDLALLEQIQGANAEAGARYLEYLVLQRRSTSKDLHTRLATLLVDQVCSYLEQDSVSKLWRAKASSYASSRKETAFLSYFASTTPDSPHKRARLKAILLLSGSSLYDPKEIRPRIVPHKSILTIELAIVDGKLGDHRSVLSTLVNDLSDATSAEAYCSLGGDVVTRKVVQHIVDSDSGDLRKWTTALFQIPPSTDPKSLSADPISRQRSAAPVNENVRKSLLKTLLEVYMDDERSSPERASRLLDSQAMNLDALDVILLVPPNWPLHLISSFLTRSLRRTLHKQNEGKILKMLSAGQNLEVKDHAWMVLRNADMFIEEAEEGEDESQPASGELDEKLAEKIASHPSAEGGLRQVDLHLQDGDGGGEKAAHIAADTDLLT